MEHIAPADHLELASAALGKLDIPHDPTSLKIVSDEFSSIERVVGSEVGDGLYARVTIRSNAAPSYPLPPLHETMLNGRLYHNQTLLWDIPTKQQGAVSARVQTISEPDQFNLAQIALGHSPGEDVLKFQKQPNEGHIKLLPWMEGIAFKTTLSADPTVKWDETMHDLGFDKSSHGRCWLHVSPAMCTAIATSAQSLIERYGDDINPVKTRPAKVDDFADALEDLDVYFTRAIVERVEKTGALAEFLSIGKDDYLQDIRESLQPTEANSLAYMKLESLGIITPNLRTDQDKAKAYTNAVADLTAHTAANLLRAETLWPRQVPPEIQNARTKAFENILEMVNAA